MLTLRAQLGTHSENVSSYDNVHKYAHVWITTTVEPPIKDTPNKEHFSIKDKTRVSYVLSDAMKYRTRL